MANRNNLPERPKTAERKAVRHFVNHLRVNLSLSEIRFDLATLNPRPFEAAPVWRFVTTPDHIQTMHRTLEHALTRYRTRFGEIREIPGDVPSVRFIDGDADKESRDG